MEARYLAGVTTSPAKVELKCACDDTEELLKDLANLAKIGEVVLLML